jgi:hypothetical protein
MFNSKALALLCCLLTGPAWADNLTLLGVGAGNPVTYTGPGDVVAGASAWFGLRAYSAAVAATGTQKAINIRNTGTSETCDVLIATSGALATTVSSCSGSSSGTALSTFCGTCAITKAYDQSGVNYCSAAACDVSQATAASQPTLNLSALGSLPGMQGAGAQSLQKASFPSTSQPVSISVVAERTGTFTLQAALFLGSEGAVFHPSANNVAQFYGSFPTASASDSAAHALQFVGNGGSSTINVDGTNTNGSAGAGAFPSGGSGTLLMIGANGNLTGFEFEAGIWASAFSTLQQNNMCHNQFAYWGTSVSC